MNIKFFSVVSAVALALIAAAPLSQAKVYSPSQFNAELKKKVGTKKETAAVKAAASLLTSALTDKKNSKNAAKYAASVVSLLKKSVKKDQGKQANTLVSALLKGYFKPVKFNLNDKVYNQALLKLLTFPPTSQKTTATSQTIYNTIKKFALTKKSTQAEVYTYWNTQVAPKSKFETSPPIVS